MLKVKVKVKKTTKKKQLNNSNSNSYIYSTYVHAGGKSVRFPQDISGVSQQNSIAVFS